MKPSMTWANSCLIAAVLTGCATGAPQDHYPVYGTVLRIIGPATALSAPPPCIASRAAQLQAGQQFAAIRYRRWASHFTATAFAAIPQGMSVAPGERLEIEPAQCSSNALATIVGKAPE